MERILPFFDRKLDRSSLESPDIETIENLHSFLDSGWLHEKIDDNTITLAMIRPNLEGCTLGNWSDIGAAEEIEKSIKNLGILAKFAIHFSDAKADEFYEGPAKELQLTLSPERYVSFSNRWLEFIDLMTTGKTTVILLHNPEGDAIKIWRDQVGHYDIENRRDATNLRGRFGLDNYNNLIHGSDSSKSVKRELSIIKKCLEFHQIDESGQNYV